MAETQLSESDAVSLREALQGQQQLLQKLYRELDDEREAAATATSEAMSMILRLQGEKAELKMEANQYKRMAEEKMCHAEEALALCEDILYQKEMEIASLEFQIQSYRKRLISLGFADATVSEQGIVHGNVRRLNSLPQAHLEAKKAGFDKKQVAIHEEAEFQVEITHESGRKSGGDINSYWEKIRRLDGRLKEISDGRSKDHGKNNSTIWRGGTWSHSLYSQLRDNSNSQDLGNNVDSQVSCELPWNQKPPMQCEEGNEDQVKEVLPYCSDKEKKKAPKDAPVVIDNGFPPAPPAVHSSVTPGDYHNMLRRIERLERARSSVGQQENIVSPGGEEMHLLKAIQEQLSVIQTQLTSQKARTPVARDEPCLDVLQEAMLYFWL